MQYEKGNLKCVHLTPEEQRGGWMIVPPGNPGKFPRR